jgi:radical SAM superfamily enzyme YgiQ (UPF0313 family)
MTSRGCPFDCNFCSVTKVFGRKFRMQSARRILAEVENALTHFTGRRIFFYDDNFTANRARVDEFCDLLIEKDLRITWLAQVRSDLAKDPELIEKMVKSGLIWVFVGFESIDDATLKAYHKSQTRPDIEKAIETFHRFGVKIHGMFMLGEDNDTVENVRRTAQFAIDNEIDTVQFMIQTPLPGTQLYDMLVKEDRILHTDWDYYNGMFVVFRPKLQRDVRGVPAEEHERRTTDGRDAQGVPEVLLRAAGLHGPAVPGRQHVPRCARVELRAGEQIQPGHHVPARGGQGDRIEALPSERGLRDVSRRPREKTSAEQRQRVSVFVAGELARAADPLS